jgi:hypothetical protein
VSGAAFARLFIALLELGSRLADLFARRSPQTPPEPIQPPPARQDDAIRAEAEAHLRERFPGGTP